MSNEQERAMATLEVTSTPRMYQLPYQASLVDQQVGHGETVSALFELKLDKLAGLFAQDDPEKYGEYLFEQVFRQSVNSETGKKGELALRLHDILRQADHADGDELRFRLEIGRLLSNLHALAWEYLFDNSETLALAADRRLTLFRDVEMDAPRREAIKEVPAVLVAVVSPSESGMAQFNQQYQMGLKPIPLAEEVERLQTLFQTLRPAIQYQMLPLATKSGQSKLDQLVEVLDDGKYHVLHLSCHGVVLNDKAWLVFADADGRPSLVSEQEFADLFKDMRDHVRLVLLDACQTAQQSQAGAFSGMVPQLLRNVPAVIGMQRTWYTGLADDRFTRSFYKDLCVHGYVDRALQRSRRDLRHWKPKRWEWGTPVLYLRLGKGQLFRVEAALATTAEPIRPQVEPARPPRHGGTGLRIGPGSVIKKGKIEGRFAGGNIVDVEGGEIPKELASAQPGIGLDIEGATLEEGVLRGEFAGGGIYRQRLAAQARERFGKKEQEQAIRNQIAYYRRRLTELHSDMDRMSGVEKKRLQTELSDIQDEIDELQQSLHGF